MSQILILFLAIFGFLVTIALILDALLYQDEQQF